MKLKQGCLAGNVGALLSHMMIVPWVAWSASFALILQQRSWVTVVKTVRWSKLKVAAFSVKATKWFHFSTAASVKATKKSFPYGYFCKSYKIISFLNSCRLHHSLPRPCRGLHQPLHRPRWKKTQSSRIETNEHIIYPQLLPGEEKK